MTSMPFRTAVSAAAVVLLLFVAADCPAALPEVSAEPTLPLADLEADATIPTVKQVLGYDWTEQITSHGAMERYLRALVKAAPDRARLVSYGASYEGRKLYYLVVTSPENMKRLEEIRAANLKLADPRGTTPAEAGDAIATSPALVWIAASVHGNELSSTEAMLLTAYHLLADQRPETRKLLEQLVVLIDPLQNPDGRERFINVYRESKGAFTDSNPLSKEHTERWPGGRFNHYLFDMNRDWFLQSQQETQGKVRAYLHWQPQIYVDAHEMGRNSSYFFVPPMDPLNPFMLPKQHDWLWKLGRQQADWFDRFGFSYTTREIFDAFFPGYGSEWPTLQGGLGILWEQASTRGLVVDREDDTQLHYHDAVLHHYVSSLATLELAADQRVELLSSFYDARSRGVQLGEEGSVRQFFLLPGPDPHRAAKLAKVLQSNGIAVYLVSKDLRTEATDVFGEKTAERVIPRGAYQIPVAQPAGRLLRALLDGRVDMDEDYVKRQLERKGDHLPDEIYDVTAWSLPLAFGVACLATEQSLPLGARWDGTPRGGKGTFAAAKVAYLVRPTDGAIQALSGWLQAGLRVHVTDKEFALDQRKFPRGTLIVKTHENEASLHDTMQQSAARYALQIVPTDTGFVDDGAHFGGPHVNWVRPPRIVLAMDQPTSYSVGHTWYLFDQVLHYPTTRVSCRNLPRLDLHKFNVLILPDGDYSAVPQFNGKFAERLSQWVRDGGTLVLVEGAAVWASSEKIGILPLQRVSKPAPDSQAKKSPDKSPAPDAEDERSSKQWPDGVPGAFLQADVFQQHWLTFGCAKTMSLFYHGNIFFEPLKPEEGRSLVEFAPEDRVLVSGFCWPETKQLIAGKTFLGYVSRGDGHIVAFAADPNYRAMYPNLQRLFVNACLFGPGE